MVAATGIAAYLDLGNTSALALQREGHPATATVLEVKKPLMNMVVNNVYIRRKLRIRIARDDGAPPYETTYADLFMLGSVPDPGDSFRVVVDPKRPGRLSPASASMPPAPQRRQSSSQGTWKFTSWRGSGSKPARPTAPATPPTDAPYQPPAPGDRDGTSVRDIVASIRELAELHERGQLTDAEFAQAKQELLGAEDSAPPE